MKSIKEKSFELFPEMQTESDDWDVIDCEAWNEVDWLNAHHFDYRGLIEKNLALDCTELHIYD